MPLAYEGRRPPVPQPVRRSLFRRTVRALLFLVVFAVAMSVLVVAAFRFVPPPTTAFMLARRIDAIATGEPSAIDYRWVPASRISPNLPIAFVAAEDQKFPAHHGFDLDAIGKALDERERGERQRGASTISQQVAKNLFLWADASWLRKGLEAYFTVLVETLWPKSRILEVYANVAEFGDGVYGVEAAAQRFFGKPAARFSRHEAALLAAVLPSPRRYRANPPTSYVANRARWIDRQVTQLGGPGYLEPSRE